MITLANIESLCKLGLLNRPGIRRIRLTTVDNISSLGVVEEPDEIFDISFRRNTGQYTEELQTSRAGDYAIKQCTFFVPRLRATVHHLCRTTMNRRIVAIITDKNGDEYTLYNARITWKKSTGDAPGTSNGTSFTLTGKESHKSFFPYMTILALTGNEGTTPGTDYGGGQGPIDFPGDPEIEACCITIEPAPIPFVPAASGNLAYRNKVFTSSITGERYFVDKKGDALQLSGSSNDMQTFLGDGSLVEFPVTKFDILDLPQENIMVFRNGVRLGYRDTVGDSLDFFTLVDNKVIISSEWPLETGETLYVYRLGTAAAAA